MTPKQFVIAFKKLGSVKAVSRQPGMYWKKTQRLYTEAVQAGLIEREPMGRKSREHQVKPTPRPTGRVKAMKTESRDVPAAGQIKRYLFTCAQNNTKLHDGLWLNLTALATHYDAEIHVSRFAYNKNGLGASGDKARDFTAKVEPQDVWWDERIVPHLSDTRIEVAPGLVWCGEMNILPTASRPLSGFESYTGRRSGIFPHVKSAMQSIASGRDEPAKFNYSTGTITLRNYIQRKAGLKAEFHHVYGALLVEVDSDGDWFVRQLNSDSAGALYDLDLRVAAGVVTAGHRLEAITWGDVHVAEADKTAHEMAWAEGGILDTLRPKYQFLHDVLHFRGRSHHDMKNPHTLYKRHLSGDADVRREVEGVRDFLNWAQRPWCKSVVVDSNHHHHMGRWLQEQDARWDPINVRFWLEMQARIYGNLHRGTEPNYLREALHEVGYKSGAKFLHDGESFIVCKDEHGGIECGQHGDLGPNGARGSPLNFARMGRRMNRGHEHSAGIVDGVFTSGTCGQLSPDWTHGPSSWSHSHILTYRNGKRAIITCWNKKWRATT